MYEDSGLTLDTTTLNAGDTVLENRDSPVSLGKRPSDTVYDRMKITRKLVSRPCNVQIGPHQDQIVPRRKIPPGDSDDIQRHPCLVHRLLERRHVDVATHDQREALAESIED